MKLRSLLAAACLAVAGTACIPPQPPGVTCFAHLQHLGLLHRVVYVGDGSRPPSIMWRADSSVIDPATGAVSRAVCPYATSD